MFVDYIDMKCSNKIVFMTEKYLNNGDIDEPQLL